LLEFAEGVNGVEQDGRVRGVEVGTEPERLGRGGELGLGVVVETNSVHEVALTAPD
jgi:hypothetical protein